MNREQREQMLAHLDSLIAGATTDASSVQVAYDGRGKGWLDVERAIAADQRVMGALRVNSDGNLVGPWVELICPNGHKIAPVRLRHDGSPVAEGAFTLTGGRSITNATVKAERVSLSPQTTCVLNDRRTWACPLLTCAWPGASFRPEYLLGLHAAALIVGLRRVPIDLMAS